MEDAPSTKRKTEKIALLHFQNTGNGRKSSINR